MKELSLFIVLIFVLILQGCVAATILGTAAVSTKIAIDPRTIGTQIDDTTLELRVNMELSKDKQIKNNTRIKVVAYQGIVLLLGQAPSTELIFRAKQIAMRAEGITKIYNEIRQSQPIKFKEVSLLDTWIAMKIRFRLLGSDKVKLTNVKIITENSEVFLLGIVTEREGKVAADIASRTKGVKNVVVMFAYIR